MALEDFAASKDKGQPVELYQFIYGLEADMMTPVDFTYTDAAAPVTHDTITYDPLPIMRSDLETKGDMSANELKITVPRSSGIADLFSSFPPTRVISVRIREGNVPNPDDPSSWALGENFPTVWLGRVLEAQHDGAETVLSCEAATVSMRRPGLRRHFQWPCPLVLYGSRCNANKASKTFTVNTTVLNGVQITLAAGWEGAYSKNNYLGGMVEWDGPTGHEYRMITKVSGNTLTLLGPVRDLTAGDPIDIVLGCPHTLAGCENLHDNIVNYGGQPYIPTFNPIGKNNHS